jgi:hypothetical protein
MVAPGPARVTRGAASSGVHDAADAYSADFPIAGSAELAFDGIIVKKPSSKGKDKEKYADTGAEVADIIYDPDGDSEESRTKIWKGGEDGGTAACAKLLLSGADKKKVRSSVYVF